MDIKNLTVLCTLPNCMDENLRWPHCAKFLQNAQDYRVHHDDAFSLSSPVQQWLVSHFKIQSFPYVSCLWHAYADGQDLKKQHTQKTPHALLQPVYFYLAHDHCILLEVLLSDAESKALFSAAQMIFQKWSCEVFYCGATLWFMHQEQIRDLETCRLRRALGRNIDLWMPRGAGEQLWRKIHNEIQMEWHQHPVNQLRRERNLPEINGLWLFNDRFNQAEDTSVLSRPFDMLISDDPCFEGLGKLAHTPVLTNIDHFSVLHQQIQRQQNVLLHLALDDNQRRSFTNDAQYEQNFFCPLFEAWRRGHIQNLHLVWINEQGSLTVIPRKSDRWKFWRYFALEKALLQLYT